MSGKVVDSNGVGLIGATVLATHQLSGTSYGVITLNNGSFYIPNIRIGGPYKIETSYIGFTNTIESDVFLALGQKLSLSFTMEEEGVALNQEK